MSKTQKTIEELMEEVVVPQEEQPYQVPENWMWVNSGHILNFIGGGTPSKSNSDYWNGDIPWATVKDIKNGYLSSTIDYITVEGLENSSATMASPNELLLITRMSPGKSAITKISTTINQDLKIVRPKIEILPYFLWLFFTMNTPLIESMSTGSTVKGIQVEKLKKITFPLPPFNEQKRIAEKVERLLSKVEEAKQLIEEAKETFDLRRAAILDKAFRGELTRKWREKNADIDIFEVQEHLDRLRADKESSPIKSNTLNVKSVNEVDEPFNLPRGWKWARLGELSYYVTSGSRDWSKYYADNGSYFIRTQDINKNKLNLTNVAYVLLPEKVEGKRSLVEPFDLLTTITGANVGKCAIVEETIPEAYVSQSVALTKLIDKSMAKYVHLSLLSTCGGGGELENRAYGIGRPVLSLEDVKNIRLPIAPYRERQVMVNMVKKLLDMEETTGNLLLIEEKLDQLKNSILSKAFRGKLGTNDPTEENAIELLKEVLQEQVK
ncbi:MULTISPECIES: restriction endonuclease subunit S [Bacillus]|uniref:restriction endonuclease subunit S n=1 Tax=Bacillus TaxID=1386 RepID=UPI00073B15D7|nr:MULTISPECIES: restriction endonuclease subunit S [Bacillus]MBL3612130.1 restriction endonuclease subunit S [Bacillus sp. RHFS18]KAF6547949.1 restriction endonuclease subunit S [Bacillus sp. EKM207B]KAF6549022.1 restriction endonuclease subunit S [Bacillus sp. EKM206B]KAF6556014.1 restriction endonuclease subunit S [Bacillus sp. EKM203B]KSV99585.1 hypothetical protein AR441_11100 [Bacillus velezensis]